MRTTLLILFGLTLTALSACSIQTAESHVPDEIPVTPSDSKSRTPVLVELFTSEGCSSCPPADRQLALLETQQPVSGAEVITLAFHVDYWDRLGWKDAYSSAEFSERQNQYVRRMRLDSSYTPQMVVDGQDEFVGSNGGRAADAITRAANSPKAAVEIKLANGNAQIELTALPTHEAATVYLAVAEDGIVTDVRSGENGGKKLPHISVVRKLDLVGQVNSGDRSFKATAKVTADSAWNQVKLKYIVFAQEDATGRVIAIGRTSSN
ncbi:MAG: DUF1223 domain-containing protein [Pyrinomonadaceae bacterium]